MKEITQTYENPNGCEPAAALPNHFGAILGFVHDKAPEGAAVIRLELQAGHCNLQGLVHGGVLMSLLDATGLWAGVPKDQTLPRSATVGMNCSFLKSVKLTEATALRAEASVTKQGRSLYFATISIFDEPNNNLIATAQGIYSSGRTPIRQPDAISPRTTFK